MANIDTHNFANCSILALDTFKLIGGAWALSLEPCHTNWQIPKYKFHVGGWSRCNLGTIFGRRTTRRADARRGKCFRHWIVAKDLTYWCLRWFQWIRKLKLFWNILRSVFIMPPPTFTLPLPLRDGRVEVVFLWASDFLTRYTLMTQVNQTQWSHLQRNLSYFDNHFPLWWV